MLTSHGKSTRVFISDITTTATYGDSNGYCCTTSPDKKCWLDRYNKGVFFPRNDTESGLVPLRLHTRGDTVRNVAA